MNKPPATGSLRQLYEGSAEDVQFGIGTLVLDDGVSVPCVVVHQPSWIRELLEILKKNFVHGVECRIERGSGQTASLFLATRDRVTVQAELTGELHALRAPAWDARLEQVAIDVIDSFEAERQRAGGFMLVLQSAAWELVVGVMLGGSCQGTTIRPRALPMPPEPQR